MRDSRFVESRTDDDDGATRWDRSAWRASLDRRTSPSGHTGYIMKALVRSIYSADVDVDSYVPNVRRQMGCGFVSSSVLTMGQGMSRLTSSCARQYGWETSSSATVLRSDDIDCSSTLSTFLWR